MMDRSKSLLFASVASLLFMMPQTVYGKDSDALEFTKDSLDTVKKNVRERNLGISAMCVLLVVLIGLFIREVRLRRGRTARVNG